MRNDSPRKKALERYREVTAEAALVGRPALLKAHRELCLNDLFYLLVSGLNRVDASDDWLFERCREVEAAPDDHLDLWSREHYKSTIITFAKTVQDILVDPNICVGIFSHTRPIAKHFLRQIKMEFEKNEFLKETFPDVLWRCPHREAPKWSEDDGIVVKRLSNAREATVEAWGIVDGQPTSKHFSLMVYDDVVTSDSVTTPEMMHKVVAQWELSRNLAARGGRTRYIGTRYHFGDLYKTIMDREAAIPRIHPATHNGAVDGVPVYLTQAELDKKRREMGPYTFSSQMLQNPTADDVQGFKREWIQTWNPADSGTDHLNLYILCDPASEKKRHSDYTVFMVIGLGPDGNYYIVDMVRDRLSLTEKADWLFRLRQRYSHTRPVMAVGYEQYGLQSDVAHYEDRMRREGYRFQITKLGGRMGKADRIRRLVPLFEQGRVYLPEELWRTNYEGRRVDLVRQFIEDEFVAFPVSSHDDMLDCLARILDDDLQASFPILPGAGGAGGYAPKRLSARERLAGVFRRG